MATTAVENPRPLAPAQRMPHTHAVSAISSIRQRHRDTAANITSISSLLSARGTWGPPWPLKTAKKCSRVEPRPGCRKKPGRTKMASFLSRNRPGRSSTRSPELQLLHRAKQSKEKRTTPRTDESAGEVAAERHPRWGRRRAPANCDLPPSIIPWVGWGSGWEAWQPSPTQIGIFRHWTTHSVNNYE